MSAIPKVDDIVCVHWLDTFTQDEGWHVIEEINDQPYKVATVGHVIAITSTIITIAATLADQRGCYHISVIPMGCIDKIDVLVPQEN